jgi:hypothetical protein
MSGAFAYFIECPLLADFVAEVGELKSLAFPLSF